MSAEAWWEDHSELVAFAHALDGNGEFADAEDAIYFFEKPWKWEAEHVAWGNAGRPADTYEWLDELREVSP
jgi:hypothetical protein